MSGAQCRHLFLEGRVAFLQSGELSGEGESEECADFAGGSVTRGKGFTLVSGLLFRRSERKGMTRMF